jgi:hypothetical protein
MNIRIPSVETTIQHLYPNVRKWELSNTNFILWDCPGHPEPPAWEEIQNHVLKDIELYNYYLYAVNRQKEYGDWKEQFDLLYDDIKSGNLENGKWVKLIESVKEKYPKPQEQPPQV